MTCAETYNFFLNDGYHRFLQVQQPGLNWLYQWLKLFHLIKVPTHNHTKLMNEKKKDGEGIKDSTNACTKLRSLYTNAAETYPSETAKVVLKFLNVKCGRVLFDFSLDQREINAEQWCLLQSCQTGWYGLRNTSKSRQIELKADIGKVRNDLISWSWEKEGETTNV